MIEKISQSLKKRGKFVIWAVLFIIFTTNYTPGTWLIGWDNLIPELNFSINLKRAIFAVWQEYHGLGLVGGMGHATELVRQFILLPFVLVLPNNVIRYLWHFGMLALGTFGVYWGLPKICKINERVRTVAALFYLLNFGTIQIFWPPYESFSSFWGFLPWLLFTFINLLKEPSPKNWKLFFLINLLASPAFYLQTFFVVYLLCIATISIFWLFKSLRERAGSSVHPLLAQELKQLATKISAIFLINAFWLLPFVYFLATSLDNPRLALIHQMTTQETMMRNEKRGFIADFLLLRGYYYDFPDAGAPLMSIWQNHFSQKPIILIGYLLAIVALIGLVKAPGWLRGLFLLCCVALLSATPPFSWLNQLFRKSAFIDQVFRSPFTKFVALGAFSFSLLFAFGIEIITKKLSQLKEKTISRLIPYLLFFGMAVYAFPAFSGNFIYPKMRLKIPDEYFQLQQYFAKQPKNARIANFPQGSFWGWTFYRWGLRGSGFLWYAIEQPILDRAFDVWNLDNEQYYWELSYNLQNRDYQSVEKVFEKYAVEFIIFDDNIVFPSDKSYAKMALNIKDFLDKSQRLTKVAEYGKISIYKFNWSTTPYLVKNPISAYPLSFTQNDPVYNRYGYYLNDRTSPRVIYPFGELFTNRLQSEIKFEIDESDRRWSIISNLPPIDLAGYSQVDDQTNKQETIPINSDFDSVAGTKTREIDIPSQAFINPHYCSSQEPDSIINFDNRNDLLRLSVVDAALCVDWKEFDYFKQFRRPFGVKVEFDYLSSTDEWPQFCFWNSSSQTCLNNKDLPPIGFSKQWQHFSDQFLVKANNDEITSFALVLDGYHQKQRKTIDYRNVKIKVYEFSKLPVTEKTINFQPQIANKQIKIDIPKLNSPIYLDRLIEKNLYRLQPYRCNSSLQGYYSIEENKEGAMKYLRLSSISDDSCVSWYFPQLPSNHGWLAEVKYRYEQGYPLLASGLDRFGEYRSFYTKLDTGQNWQRAYFVVPPYDTPNEGVIFSFSNTSYNQLETANDIADLRIVPIPWDYLKSIRFEKKEGLTQSQLIPLQSYNNIWFYHITERPNTSSLSGPNDNTYLFLPQSYDSGWLAFYFDKGKPVFLKKHQPANSWANSWQINSDSRSIYVIFWPQLLEFIGLGLIVATLVHIFKARNDA